MRLLAILTITLLLPVLRASAQTDTAAAPTSRPPTRFPSAEFVLRDGKHKEQKSRVQLQGGQLTIVSGVGTPTSINSLSFSTDGKILVAGKDFGRAVLWNVYSGAAALSPDGQLLAGAKDDSLLSQERTDGVWIWRAKNLLQKRGLDGATP